MDRAAEQPAATLPTDYDQLIMQRELLREATQRLIERLQIYSRAERPEITDTPDNQGIVGADEV
jgi:hypothetical protein